MFMTVQLCDSACVSAHVNIPVCALAVCLHSPVCVYVCVYFPHCLLAAAAAAAAKSLQWCLTLCDPIDGSPTVFLPPAKSCSPHPQIPVLTSRP